MEKIVVYRWWYGYRVWVCEVGYFYDPGTCRLVRLTGTARTLDVRRLPLLRLFLMSPKVLSEMSDKGINLFGLTPSKGTK